MRRNIMRKKIQPPVEDIPQLSTFDTFDRLSPAEKEKVWKYFDRKIPMSELRDPTPAQKAILARHRKKMGRPKIGLGAKVVAVTLEKGLLQRVDAYAKKCGMKRAEMISQGLRLVMRETVE